MLTQHTNKHTNTHACTHTHTLLPFVLSRHPVPWNNQNHDSHYFSTVALNFSPPAYELLPLFLVTQIWLFA